MTKVGWILGSILLLLVVAGGGWYWAKYSHSGVLYSPLGSFTKKVDDRPLDKYSYENLRKRQYDGSEIKFDHVLRVNPYYTTWLFFYYSDGKKVSGVADMPAKYKDIPSAALSDSGVVKIVMIHGFVEEKTYYSGFGTENVAGELARQGYITLAPDLLGLGQSDPNPKDEFEARFQTYITVLNLLESVDKQCHPAVPVGVGGAQDDKCKVGIWGHSNGGQIALSVLEISGKPIPTVLWAPVSKFFPYSILYYIDQFEDQGKYLRGSLAKFESKYDVKKYSITSFFDWINAPILLQQGAVDRDVPVWWSDELAKRLADSGKQIDYKVYPGADHNLQPAWNRAVADVESFFAKEFK